MTVIVQESAIKDLKNIDKTTTTKILLQIKKPEDYPNLSNIKKLKNHYPPLRYRIADYRVLFDVEGDTLIVV